MSKTFHLWCEKNGMVYFTLVSDGTTGRQWMNIFSSSPRWTRGILLSPDFKPTNGVAYHVVVLKGTLFNDGNRLTDKIRNNATRLNLGTPNAELGCLIRMNFSDKDIKAMGLRWIVAMHYPVNDVVEGPGLLCAGPDHRYSGLLTVSGKVVGFDVGVGFAFVTSQDKSLASDTNS